MSFNLHLHNSAADKILKMATLMLLAASFCLLLIARCSEASFSSSKFNCDFTRRMCQWRRVAVNSYDFKWTRRGRGNYLYTDATYPAKQGDKARFATKEKLLPTPTTGMCLSFSYRMESKSSDKQSSYALRVFIRRGGLAEELIWNRVGDQGKKKLSSNVTLMSTLPFEVIFESERGTGDDKNRIDTQLDDIKFQNGKCEKSWFEQKCGIDMKGMGCFKDRIANRVMGELLTTQREANNGGPLIDWNNYQASLERLLCQCATLTKAKGYKYFGLQFYGECWSAPGEIDYDIYGTTAGHCMDGGLITPGACNGPRDGACVGQAFTNYVYQLS